MTGDLLLAHYLLDHNIGGNTSATTRRAVYFRVKRFGHDPRWRDFLRDPWLDYDAVRAELTCRKIARFSCLRSVRRQRRKISPKAQHEHVRVDMKAGRMPQVSGR